MTPERWQQIEKLYHSALKLEANSRTAFLEEACAGDEDLRHEVESLLAQQPQAESIVEASALGVTAQAMAEKRGQSLVGRQLGAYQILSLLGAGGMGEVYKAQDTRLNRTVAIKVLPRHLSERVDLRQRSSGKRDPRQPLPPSYLSHLRHWQGGRDRLSGHGVCGGQDVG